MIIRLLNGWKQRMFGPLSGMHRFYLILTEKSHCISPSVKKVWHCYSSPGSFKESPKMRRCLNEFCSGHLRLKRRNILSIKYSEISKWKQVYWMSKTINSNLAAYHCWLTTKSIKNLHKSGFVITTVPFNQYLKNQPINTHHRAF